MEGVRYSITLSYDGTRYCGWQIQPHGTSVQELLEQTLSQILQHPTKVSGSGRTDSGVHALGQVAHFDAKPLDPQKLLRSLNGLLPPDIRILSCAPADENFHARFGVKSKTYRYLIDTRPTHHPLHVGQRLHHPRSLDIAAMRIAAEEFVGERDFASVANVGSGARTTRRHLYRLDITESDGIVAIEFEGNGFLYKMVRNIVGLLLEVGRGRRTAKDCRTILAACDRRCAGRPAPACGLYLVEVRYQTNT